MKKKNKIGAMSLLVITYCLVFCYLFVGLNNEIRRILPQLKEKFIAIQTVKLDGELYVCGSINNKDKESLYCRGFDDGYNWAVRQLKIDSILKELNN